jgi:hypothetical protein
MPDKTCPKCSEMVDEAKAFCPACGHSFVDEQKRTEASRYDQADHTMQMGATMYNNMLSDMGLNLKKEPEKRVEVLKPAVPATQVLQPVASAQSVTTPQLQGEPEQKSRKKFWIITIVVAFVLLLLIVAALLVVIGGYLYFKSVTP